MQLRKEAWKKFMRCSTNWAMKPLTLGAGQLWVHMFPSQLVEHRTGNREVTGSNPQLHELRSLRRSFLHFHFISAVHIWFISYIINNLSWQRRPFTCWTMEENYGLLFCFWKVLLVIFSLFLSYWKDHGLLRSWNFATMATWRNDFSSLLTTPHTNVIFSWKYCSLPFEWWL